MQLFRPIIPFLLFIAVISCQSPRSGQKGQESKPEATINKLTGSFSVSGAYALYPLISQLAGDFMTLHPGVRINVERMGTGEGITALLEKKCQLAMISRPLTDEEMNAGIVTIPVAKDGVAPIVNQRNPYISRLLKQGLSPEEFVRIFTSGAKVTWGSVLDTSSSDYITVYTREDESGASDIFARFLYTKAGNLKGTRVTGDNEMIRSIQNNKLAIGFCNFSYAFDTASGERTRDIQVIPSDLDFDNRIDRIEVPFVNLEEAHRSLWLGFYPDDLCRELTLGFVGKPDDPVIIEFLYFVLGDGQKRIKSMGLCPLNNIYIRDAMERLD
jgi:phosphate transport system substrate-binding protein